MDKAHNETDKILARIEKNIKETYGGALKELKKELVKITNEISNTSDPDKVYRQLQNKKRLEQRILKMTNILQNSNKAAIAFLNDDITEIYSLNYNWGAYTVVTESLFDVDYTLYSASTIKEILKDNANPFTLVAINELKDKGNIYRELKSQLTRALLKGESMKEIAKRIAKVTNKNMNDSLRIAQTETTRVENLGRLDSFKFAEKQGLKLKKSWLATMDKRTRETHQRVNQEEVDLNKPFSNGLMYPGDPNGRASEVIRCRCAMTSEFVGFEKSEQEKQLDETLRKISFEEWKERKNKPEKIKKEEIKSRKTTKKEITKKETIKKEITKKEVKQKENKKIKYYSEKDLKTLSEKQLNQIAFDLAKEYYPKSNINFGNKTINQALEELKKVNRSKTSLIKDIKSMQKKLGVKKNEK